MAISEHDPLRLLTVTMRTRLASSVDARTKTIFLIGTTTVPCGEGSRSVLPCLSEVIVSLRSVDERTMVIFQPVTCDVKGTSLQLPTRSEA